MGLPLPSRGITAIAVACVIGAACDADRAKKPAASATVAEPCSKEEQDRIVHAVQAAHYLERSLYKRRKQMTSKDKVYQHFRQGFGATMAQALTDFVWNDNRKEISSKADYFALPVGIKPVILTCGPDNATISYVLEADDRYPEDETNKPRLIVQSIEREDGRWVIAHWKAQDAPRPAAKRKKG